MNRRRLLMISGDRALAEGKKGPFFHTLEEFSAYWDRIDIICPHISNPSSLNPLFGNVHIHPSPWLLWLQPLWILKKGKELFKEHIYELITVHEYAPFYNGLGAKLLHRAIRIPYILEIMHVSGFPKAATTKEFLYRFFTKIYIRFDMRSAAAVRVINQHQTKEFLINAGVPSEKIKYIPAFYIDLTVFKVSASLKHYDLIYVARLEKNKGIFNLIQAVEIVKKQKANISLLIVGSGPLQQRLQSYVLSHGLSDTVTFSGWLEGPNDVAKMYQSARVFVNPSFNEGGPRVALEAMACGLPVITTRVGIMPDIIRDGETGVLCDWSAHSMATAIQRMLNDHVLEEQSSAEGLRTAMLFERRAAIKNYADQLQLLL